MTKFDVVLSTYNGQSFLHEQIESILAHSAFKKLLGIFNNSDLNMELTIGRNKYTVSK